MRIPQFNVERLEQRDDDPNVRMMHEFNRDLRTTMKSLERIGSGSSRDVGSKGKGMRYIFAEDEKGNTVRLRWRNGQLEEA